MGLPSLGGFKVQVDDLWLRAMWKGDGTRWPSSASQIDLVLHERRGLGSESPRSEATLASDLPSP